MTDKLNSSKGGLIQTGKYSADKLNRSKEKEYQEVFKLIHDMYMNTELRNICKLATLGKFEEIHRLQEYMKEAKILVKKYSEENKNV